MITKDRINNLEKRTTTLTELTLTGSGSRKSTSSTSAGLLVGFKLAGPRDMVQINPKNSNPSRKT